MTTAELAALARTRLSHVVLPDARGVLRVVTAQVPDEGPADNCRNALQALACIEGLSPATYLMVLEIGRAQRRIHAAVTLLEHGAPDRAVAHIRGAVEALIAATVDWAAFEEVRSAVARLLRAWFQLAPTETT